MKQRHTFIRFPLFPGRWPGRRAGVIHTSPKREGGFTLIEVTVVGFIILLLSLGLVLILDPFELLDRSRDDVRAREIGTLVDIMEIARSEGLGSFDPDGGQVNSCVGESAQKIFVSVPDSESPPDDLPSGWTYAQVSEANLLNHNGTGWLPINFSNAAGGIAQIQKKELEYRDTVPSITLDNAPTRGSLLVATLGNRNSTPVPTPPAGWSTAIIFNQSSGIYYKIAGASESATITFTGSTPRGHLIVTEWGAGEGWGVDPLDQTDTNDCLSGSSTCGSGNVTTTARNELVMASFGIGSGDDVPHSRLFSDDFSEEGYGCTGGCGSTEGASTAASLLTSSEGTYSTTLDITPGSHPIGAAIASFVPAGSGLNVGAGLSHLPVDPTNTFASGHYYSYVCGRGGSNFELNARMQSEKYRVDGSEDVESTDGGDNSLAYETGSDLGLYPKFIETWGVSGSGTAWTIAQGADYDWTHYDDRFSHAEDISSGGGRTDGFMGLDVSNSYAYVSGQTAVDVEIVTDVLYSASGNSDADAAMVMVRRTGDTTFYYLGYTTDNNVGWVNGVSGTGLAIAKNIGGTKSVIAELSTSSWTVGNTYRIRVRVQGTDLKLKVWDIAGAEPGAWDLETTDGSIADSGNFGPLYGSKDDTIWIFDDFTLVGR